MTYSNWAVQIRVGLELADTMLPQMIAILFFGEEETGRGKGNVIHNSPLGAFRKVITHLGKVVVLLIPVSKNKGKGKGRVIRNSEPRKIKQAGHHLWRDGIPQKAPIVVKSACS